MQEFAQQNATPPTPPPGEHWPPAEELAAYIDGGLGKAERKRVTEHLASCEECYAVYADTLRFQLDSSPASPEDNVVPFRRRPAGPGAWWWRSAAAAAAMLLVGAGGFSLFFLLPPPHLPTDQVTSAIPGRSTEGLWRGPTFRGGGGEGEEAPLDQASFQMGVQLVNLQVSLKAGKAGEAQDFIARILILLDAQYLTVDLENDYKRLTGKVGNGPPRDLLPEAARLAGQVRDVFDTDALDFGQWVEAGRQAVRTGEPTFLQEAESRRFFRRFFWRQKLGLGETKIKPEALQSLEEINGVLRKGQLARTDYKKLQASFDRILEIYYPET